MWLIEMRGTEYFLGVSPPQLPVVGSNCTHVGQLRFIPIFSKLISGVGSAICMIYSSSTT